MAGGSIYMDGNFCVASFFVKALLHKTKLIKKKIVSLN